MNENTKKWLPVVAIAILSVIAACSSPICLWMDNSNTLTAIQGQMFDIAYQIRQGFLAYTEVDGHYGPVVYELIGLGYLPTTTHLVHAIEEMVLIFVSMLTLYHTARFYTSEVMSVVCAALVIMIGWNTFTTAGAEEIIFPLLALCGYHFIALLRNGYTAGHHIYLIAIELGLVFFAQPGYIFIWVFVLAFMAIHFKQQGLEKDQYKRLWASMFEGLITVAIPMLIYLWFFHNIGGFFKSVVGYNFSNMGTLGGGLSIVCGTPAIILLAVVIFGIFFNQIEAGTNAEFVAWLAFAVVVLFVVAFQGDNLASFQLLTRVIYIVPLAIIGSLLDKVLHTGGPVEPQQEQQA